MVAFDEYSMTPITACGAAKLLSAIFDEDEGEVKRYLGLPVLPPPYRCLDCGKRIHNKIGRCQSCFSRSKRLDVACSWCGQFRKRLASEIIRRVSQDGYEHFFCDQKCVGQGHRKHDWGMIWQAHLQTAYGARQLSQLLGIPRATISHILAKMRQAQKG